MNKSVLPLWSDPHGYRYAQYFSKSVYELKDVEGITVVAARMPGMAVIALRTAVQERVLVVVGVFVRILCCEWVMSHDIPE